MAAAAVRAAADAAKVNMSGRFQEVDEILKYDEVDVGICWNMLVDVMLACCWLFCRYFSKVSCHSVCQSELVRSQSGTCRLVEVIFWFFRISVTILLQCIQRRRLLRRIASDILSECVSNSIRWDPMPDGIFGTSVQLGHKAMILRWCDDDAMMFSAFKGAPWAQAPPYQTERRSGR